LFFDDSSLVAHHGLLRMCAYILQTLSADRAFGIAITSSPVTLTLPAKYVVPGTAADFLITVSSSLLLSAFFSLLSLTTLLPPFDSLSNAS